MAASDSGGGCARGCAKLELWKCTPLPTQNRSGGGSSLQRHYYRGVCRCRCSAAVHDGWGDATELVSPATADSQHPIIARSVALTLTIIKTHPTTSFLQFTIPLKDYASLTNICRMQVAQRVFCVGPHRTHLLMCNSIFPVFRFYVACCVASYHFDLCCLLCG